MTLNLPDPAAAIATAPMLSVIVPAFNEEEVLRTFHGRLSAALGTLAGRWEVVYVNDGSTDARRSCLLPQCR
jgi:polyisoprenyl-phosphate glycosyltransferase